MCESCENYCEKESNSEHALCSGKNTVTIITEKVVGPTGPRGPPGPCYEPKCVDCTVDFSKPFCKYNSLFVYKVLDKFLLAVYGFAVSHNGNCETKLVLKNDCHNPCDNGIGLGCKDYCGDSKHFLQIDLGDYIRIKNLSCCVPKMRVCGFREKFYIHGSNKLGELGQQLHNSRCKDSFVIPSFNSNDCSDCSDLKQYGVIPFRYISISSCAASIVLNMLSFSVC